MITLTEKAQKAVRRFIRGADAPVAGLRLAVTGGGCSGLQYEMSLATEAAADDTTLESGGAVLLLGPESLPLLQGLEIDFVDTPFESGFKFHNPNASGSCGCGKSFAA